MSHNDFGGKVAVVTGAAMGIGKACAEAFCAGGASVVIADIAEEQGRAVAEALGERALFVRTDVTRMAEMEAMAKAAHERFGGIDILVNNAAQAIGGRVDEIDEATWE